MIEDSFFESYLDLRGTPCPVNFVRCSLALEGLSKNSILTVDLDKGEPEEMIVSGLREKGYKVEIKDNKNLWATLLIYCEKI